MTRSRELGQTRPRMSVLERTQWVPVELHRAFEFFADPQNLAAITPPWLHFRIVEAPERAQRGALIRYRLRIKGVPVRWLTEITEWHPPHTFTDVQLSGPYWVWEHTHIDPVDIREVSQTVEGQEILTSDKIGVRVTLIAQFKVADPVVARHSVGDHTSQLYQDLQLTLRDAITGRTLEELLKERDVLSGRIQEDVAQRAKKYGVELTRVGVKDMVLPGTVRTVFLQEVEAELKGRASLVAARHEVAAARARANMAKLLQENPHILRLQELETLAALASKAGNVLIIPGLQALFSREPAAAPAETKPAS